MFKRLLVLGFCLVAAPYVATADDVKLVRHIDVTGEGRLHVKPDKADVQFTVFAEHKELQQAKKMADEKLASVLVILTKLGIAKGDIQNNYSSIMPRYRYESTVVSSYGSGKQIFEAYEAQYAITVIIKKLDLVGVVLQKLTEAGIDRVGNVQYGLLDERPTKEKALTEAIEHAKRKADIVAKAMAVEVGEVISFTESGVQFNPMPMVVSGMANKMMASDSAMVSNIAPPVGDIEVTQSVSVSYGIKE